MKHTLPHKSILHVEKPNFLILFPFGRYVSKLNPLTYSFMSSKRISGCSFQRMHHLWPHRSRHVTKGEGLYKGSWLGWGGWVSMGTAVGTERWSNFGADTEDLQSRLRALHGFICIAICHACCWKLSGNLWIYLQCLEGIVHHASLQKAVRGQKWALLCSLSAI